MDASDAHGLTPLYYAVHAHAVGTAALLLLLAAAGRGCYKSVFTTLNRRPGLGLSLSG